MTPYSDKKTTDNIYEPELVVLRVSRGGASLVVNVYRDSRLSNQWRICDLNYSERTFLQGSGGGRFQKYKPSCLSNPVTVKSLSSPTLEEYWQWSAKIIEWMGENVTKSWSMAPELDTHTRELYGVQWETEVVHLRFFFEDENEAVLFKLSMS